MNEKLTHIDEEGNARMVGITQKPLVHRLAIAEGRILLKPETLSTIQAGQIHKGNVLSIAQLAGIMSAKRTADLIPLCHPIPIDSVDVQLQIEKKGILIRATVENIWKTGVEMEALTAVSAAALTVYDMVKAIDSTGRITDIHLVEKRKTPLK